MTKDINELQATLAQQQRSITAYKAENTKLRNRNKEQERELQTLHADLTLAKDAFASMEKEMREKKGLLDKTTAHNKELLRKVSLLEAQNRANEIRINELTNSHRKHWWQRLFA